MMQIKEQSNRTGHTIGPCTSQGRDLVGTLNLNGGQDHEKSGMGVLVHGRAFAWVPPACRETNGMRLRTAVSASFDQAR